jgi:hypothetical protein
MYLKETVREDNDWVKSYQIALLHEQGNKLNKHDIYGIYYSTAITVAVDTSALRKLRKYMIVRCC